MLDRKLFLWLASHSIGGLCVPRVDIMHLRNALYLDVRPKTWIAGLRNVAPESGEETLEIDVVRRALSLADIYFSDAQWRSLLHRVRDAHTIEILSDADGDAPEQRFLGHTHNLHFVATLQDHRQQRRNVDRMV